MSRKIIGFDRKIEQAWLDYAAALACRRLPIEVMRKELWGFLEGRVSAGSSGWNSDRGKVITVLMRIWGPASGRYEQLRERALDEVASSNASSRVAIQWALCLGAYPFFGDVARVVGQHLSLHGEVHLSEARRRLIEAWGDRTVTRNATQRILRSMVDWGVLQDTAQRGVYKRRSEPIAATPSLGRLLVEGLLLTQAEGALPVSKLRSHPSLFPFRLELEDLALGKVKEHLRLERDGPGADYLRLGAVRRTN